MAATRMFDLGTYENDPGRAAIRALHREPEAAAIGRLLQAYVVPAETRAAVTSHAVELIAAIRRRDSGAGPVEALMREYDLSSDEGLVLMMLAEALLRIPDAATRDLLIRDKLVSADFARHIGASPSVFVNLSTRALDITGRALRAAQEKKIWPRLAARMGEPMLRQSMLRAMAVVGGHFVLGRTIDEALSRARANEKRGFRHSYDMLGEAALTDRDARRYYKSYEAAIHAIGKSNAGRGPIAGPGISIKLSALHPRYELKKRGRVLKELYPRILELAVLAKSYDMGCTIDAEEADRLDLSLDIIGRLIHAPELKGWNGLGLAVQAYSKRILPLIDWLVDEAGKAGRRLMVRLVKGAYWDSEIKRAQEQGLPDYPVYTHKDVTDLSYLVAASKMLAAGDGLYAQFATHNAATAAAIRAFAEGRTDYEFQRLHGMGEALHDLLMEEGLGVSCRIYAPVGAHHDLLAYLVRRLLENGASGSFVNQLANPDVPIASLARDPAAVVASLPPARIPLPPALYEPERKNSLGFDFGDPAALAGLDRLLNAEAVGEDDAWPVVGGVKRPGEGARTIHNPAARNLVVGLAHEAGTADIEAALVAAVPAQRAWERIPVDVRAACLERAADRIEADRARFMALAIREAGKSLPAAVAEVREAVDLLRYYAASARKSLVAVKLPGPTGETDELTYAGRGVMVCISPWNFPLAIFLGQVSAALVAGNAVIAKPAEQTPLIAARAVRFLHEAGIPHGVLSILPGDGAKVGAKLVGDRRVAGVVFTGSTATAQAINRTLAARDGAIATLVAETGGINVMIVDSSALLEQAVADIMVSAFDSAGQRCSALRCVYVQDEIADDLASMLGGAIAELQVGDPADLATDIGPVIDQDALDALTAHAGEVGKPFAVAPAGRAAGNFFAPRAVWTDGIAALGKEVFGPFLHVARYQSDRLEAVLEAINESGYGLTLGLQTRIDETVERVRRSACVGNFYVNRTMIGATVGTQPFGGEGLSGTGPKAGGPNYVRRFATERVVTINTTAAGGNASLLMAAAEAAG
ncbi:MAG TPA: bifunctional proline dehydrogenase/L-glutamate gamma-semialdehyde dehydrogenase PutA [Alphaproteobacteria bacterium]|jgi:RHH-type proline utilization regulon transcriptional repressor/proline dehydrogenase/delta 1-pyrroline-5-carboxylate dehydrogenase|nr:bifunctional proline dehydrogenase/L-glutamate gamma-semialdehyde dehydrogenase PutA [Alphaproteobacteria bacterium]